ncbi:MAG: BamA/TamA family outer membrane protein [Elusimicrobia bacterium]|nr:BamA/TamA family outer membrane protein [Elusimicrobiota bacterium]
MKKTFFPGIAICFLWPLSGFAQTLPESPGQVIISTIAFTGTAGIEKSEFERILPVKNGDLYKPELADVCLDIIISYYHSRGYMNAQGRVETTVSGSSAAINVAMEEGERFRFGSTEFAGLEKLRSKIVSRELDYAKDEPYNYSKIMSSLSRLHSLGWFEELSVKTSTTPLRQVDVLLVAKEKTLKWVKGGVGYGSEEQERLSMVLTHNNFFSRGYKMETTGLWSRIWLEYKAEFLNRHFWATKTEFSNSGSWRREFREGYEMEAVKGALGLGRKLTSEIQGNLKYRLQRNLIYNVSPEISKETPGRSRTRAVSMVLNMDTTDHPFYPAKGQRLEFLIERSGGLWGGDINFYKTHLSLTAYFRIFSWLSMAGAAKGGFVRETAPSRDVPIFEKFFAGGANSIRGYAERSVGPADSKGSPMGGKVISVSNTELRYPIYKKLRGAVFADGGQTAERTSGISLSKWKYGGGIGLRYATPVGPLRVDLGWKLNPDEQEEADPWRLHITLGEIF